MLGVLPLVLLILPTTENTTTVLVTSSNKVPGKEQKDTIFITYVQYRTFSEKTISPYAFEIKFIDYLEFPKLQKSNN